MYVDDLRAGCRLLSLSSSRSEAFKDGVRVFRRFRGADRVDVDERSVLFEVSEELRRLWYTWWYRVQASPSGRAAEKVFSSEVDLRLLWTLALNHDIVMSSSECDLVYGG